MPFSLRRVTARHGFAIALGLATLAGAATLRVWDPEPVVRSRLAAFDFYQRVWTRPARAAPVSVVDIDEASLSRIGQWPWPRRQIAALVDRLTEAGAAVVALDMILAEPDRSSPSLLRPILKAEGLIGTDASQAWPDYDAELAAAFRRGRVVASFGMHGIANDARPALKTGFAILGDDPSAGLSRYAGAVTSIPALEAAALGNGGISVVSATDQTIRRTPLLAALDGQVYPSLVLEALRVAQGRDSIAVKSSDGHGLSAVRVGRVEIPLERDGQMWLRYAETPPGRTLPAWSVLDQSAADLRARVGGRIVLVGFSAVGLSDLRATPLNPFEPGVNIHAEAISQIIAADWLGRPSWTVATELAAVIVMALAVILALAGFGARLEQAPKPPRIHLRHIEHRHHATRDQHHELQHIGPDHGPYTPEPCAHHRCADRDRDAPTETEAGQQLEHQRDRVDAHALPQHRTQEEQQRGDPAEHGAETVADVVVGARVILCIETRHDEMPDHPLRDHAGERELQVAIVAALCEHQRRHTDEGHAADRGRDDGSRDGRPRQAA